MKTTSPLTLRLLAGADRSAAAPLLVELLTHYGLESPPEEAMRASLSAQPPGVEMLVAFGAEGPVGLASFAQLFPGLGAAPQIYMKELYVSSAHRGEGIGEVLLHELARVAVARGCTRLDWSTEKNNRGARAFYDRIGARVVEEKVYYRLDAAGLSALLERADSKA